MRLFFVVSYLLHLLYLDVDMALTEMYYLPMVKPEVIMRTNDDTVPWMGVLRVKYDFNDTSEFVSVVTLIAKQFAIGCAEDINKIHKKMLNSSTMVTFYNSQLVPWNTFVKDYFLHPEYEEYTINTIALLKLDSEIKVPSFMWQPVQWPKDFYNYGNHFSVYYIGFTDKGLIVEQEIKRMESVDKQECIDFYQKEKMDFKKIWPTHYNCFKVVGENESCVFESGMAVATNYTGRWTLIGISTYGPGCSVPARFIEVFPYLPWIESIMKQHSPKPIIYTRRYTWKDEPGEDSDTKLLAIMYNNTIDLMPNLPKEVYMNLPNFTETCSTSGENIRYQEKGYIKLSGPVPSAVAFYSVSLFDDNYDFQCVRVKLDCVAKTQVHMFVQRGFGQEDLEPLIKQLVPPNEKGEYPDKVLYLTDNYRQYRNKSIITVWFKFIFIRTGRIHVSFYGTPKPETTTSTETPSTTPAPTGSTEAVTTTRRPYPTYLEWNIYKAGKNG